MRVNSAVLRLFVQKTLKDEHHGTFVEFVFETCAFLTGYVCVGTYGAAAAETELMPPGDHAGEQQFWTNSHFNHFQEGLKKRQKGRGIIFTRNFTKNINEKSHDTFNSTVLAPQSYVTESSLQKVY